MRSELERIGVPNRGKVLTDSQLCAMLRERGYDVMESLAAEKKHEAGER